MFLMLTESTLHFMTLTWGLSNKKHTLAGKVHNWCTYVYPEIEEAEKPSPIHSASTEPISTNSLGVSSARTSQTVTTTVSLAKDPPPSLMDSSETSHIPVSDKDGDEDIDEDVDDDEDADNDNNDKFEEDLSSLLANEKGKGKMQVSIQQFNKLRSDMHL